MTKTITAQQCRVGPGTMFRKDGFGQTMIIEYEQDGDLPQLQDGEAHPGPGVHDKRGGATVTASDNGRAPWYKVTDNSMENNKRGYRIRKLTERECLRLMDVGEGYIDAMERSGVARSNIYKAAGNSIVVACMEGIFENLFYPPARYVDEHGQLSMF